VEVGLEICGLLVPADEEAPETVEPRVGAFDDPASGLPAGLVEFGLRLLLAPCVQVQLKPVFCGQPSGSG
jgi:hypothetical protein